MGKYGTYGIQHGLNSRKQKKKSVRFSLIASFILCILAIFWLIAEYKYDPKRQLFTVAEDASSFLNNTYSEIKENINETGEVKLVESNKDDAIKVAEKLDKTTKTVEKADADTTKTEAIETDTAENLIPTTSKPANITEPASISDNLLSITLANNETMTVPEFGVEHSIINEIESQNTNHKAYILDRVTFKIDSYDLSPEAQVQVGNIAKIIHNYSDVNVLISGHTDNLGKQEVNAYFSLRRAKSVRNFLVKKGIARNRIKVVGKGESEPIVPNTNRNNRNKNRRIDIRIMP